MTGATCAGIGLVAPNCGRAGARCEATARWWSYKDAG